MIVCVGASMLLGGCAGDGRSPVAAQEAVTWPESQAVRLTVDSCNASPEGTVVEETEELVRVRVEAFDSTDGCADAVTVCLGRPLASRQLVDATTADRIPVREEGGPVLHCAIPLEGSG